LIDVGGVIPIAFDLAIPSHPADKSFSNRHIEVLFIITVLARVLWQTLARRRHSAWVGTIALDATVVTTIRPQKTIIENFNAISPVSTTGIIIASVIGKKTGAHIGETLLLVNAYVAGLGRRTVYAGGWRHITGDDTTILWCPSPCGVDLGARFAQATSVA
tara:strand:+ start:167 stop:649 length:483 start_codon:yes stop_codon:yes gene_type:complete